MILRTGLENRDYGSRDPSSWPCGTLYPQKLALILPTSGGRSVDIVRSPTQATEFVMILKNIFLPTEEDMQENRKCTFSDNLHDIAATM
jgi:hypothetical protein